MTPASPFGKNTTTPMNSAPMKYSQNVGKFSEKNVLAL
jgi:hypothetical protein